MRHFFLKLFLLTFRDSAPREESYPFTQKFLQPVLQRERNPKSVSRKSFIFRREVSALSSCLGQKSTFSQMSKFRPVPIWNWIYPDKNFSHALWTVSMLFARYFYRCEEYTTAYRIQEFNLKRMHKFMNENLWSFNIYTTGFRSGRTEQEFAVPQ